METSNLSIDGDDHRAIEALSGDEPEWPMDNPHVTQHFTRSVCDGLTSVVAYFRLEFEASREKQILHVPFFPALHSVPKVEAYASEHENVRIRLTDIQKFGLRIEVIRSATDLTKDSVVVEIVASEVTKG